MNYHEYLKTPGWGRIRKRELERARYCCEFCGGYQATPPLGEGLHVHHLSYEHLGNEPSRDLIVLCADCHTDAHVFPTTIGVDVRRFADRRWIERVAL